MSAVSSAKGVVDKKISVGSEFLGELGHILLLLLIEAGVLEEQNRTILHLVYALSDALANAVRGHDNFGAEELRKAWGNWAEREFVFWAILWAA